MHRIFVFASSGCGAFVCATMGEKVKSAESSVPNKVGQTERVFMILT
jgi:hypothetical protein